MAKDVVIDEAENLSTSVPATEGGTVEKSHWRIVLRIVGVIIGLLIVLVPPYFLGDFGLQALGPLLGVLFIVFSLFGDLPPWIAWTRRLGVLLMPGIVFGTIALLLLALLPSQRTSESPFLAFSPFVWLAYIPIILVSIAFEASVLPDRIYQYCKSLSAGPEIVIPLYVLVAGLLGNIFDGVSIIAISVVIFRALLPWKWVLRASFALLFGGLVSNLITVAAEPTNIKFQDVLSPYLDRVQPAFWFTNWPISILCIVLPTCWLFWGMKREHIHWEMSSKIPVLHISTQDESQTWKVALSTLALALLGIGIIMHAVASEVMVAGGQAVSFPFWSWLVSAGLPLWPFLLLAGMVAFFYLVASRQFQVLVTYITGQWSVWGRLMVIFSLLWFLSHGLTQQTNVFAAFFTWPEFARYGVMVVLSLCSSITDNVALAAMQAQIILSAPLAVWQVRLLLILFTWSGGFTPFGCLQSLALNNNLKLSTGQWFRETLLWSALSLIGGLIGLGLIAVFYPTAIFLPH
jgi:hypothetical protein